MTQSTASLALAAALALIKQGIDDGTVTGVSPELRAQVNKAHAAHVADTTLGPNHGQFEVTLPGVNGAVDTTDSLVLWVAATSPSTIIALAPDGTKVRRLERVQSLGELDFVLPADGPEFADEAQQRVEYAAIAARAAAA